MGAAVEQGGIGVWSPGRRRLTVGLVATITLVAIEALSVATVMPVIGRDLGGIDLYGWVFSAFFLSSLVGIAVAGRLADRTGPAMPLAAGLACFAAGLVIGGLAPSMAVLVGGRVLQGLGAGAVPAAAYTAVGRALPSEARPRMFAVLSTAWVVPGLVGPSLAALVAAGPGWRWVFLGLVPVVALSSLVCVPALRALPPPPEPDGASGKGIGASVAVAGGAGLLLAGLSSSSPLAAVPLVLVGGTLGVAALRRFVPAGTLRALPGLPATVATRGLLTFGFFAVDAYVPLTLTSVRHTSTAYGGLALTAATLAWTAGAWTQERLIPASGPRRLVGGGLAVLLGGVALLSSVLLPVVPVWVAVAAWGVAGFGMGSAYSPLSVAALDRATPGEEGRVSAAVQLSDTLGTALGTGAAGAIVAVGHRHAWSASSALGAAFGLAGAAIVVGLAAARGVPGVTGSARTG